MNIYGRKGAPLPKGLKQSQLELEELRMHLQEAFDKCKLLPDTHREFIRQLEQQVNEYLEVQE